MLLFFIMVAKFISNPMIAAKIEKANVSSDTYLMYLAALR